MAVSIANQWSGSFSQPASFQNMPPALQSGAIALTPANSVGGGSGTPSAGNWLFTLVGMNETTTSSQFTVGDSDDIHSFWRPGDVTRSVWAVSQANALTRTSVWYTANLQRAPSYVYVAPNGAFAAFSVLVIEVAGLGPWDTVSGIFPDYAAAATALSLSLAAPSAQALLIGAVTGDSTAAGQSFAPSGWTALSTVSATNGVDHTCDAVLTSAYIVTSGAVSVSASATSATDLSGVVIGVLTSAPSPIPAGNQAWPYMILEAAIGSGYETPADQMTWTTLNNRAVPGSNRRFWGWGDSGGVPYALGQLQSSSGSVTLDNGDGALSPANPASLHYTSAAGWSPLAAFYDPLVLAAAPVAWWKLADTAGSSSAADSSGSGHTGTATSVTFGTANDAVTGNTTAAFASGSSSHILSSYNPALSAATAECWANLNGLSQTGTPVLMADSATGSDHHGFALVLSSGTTPQALFGNGTASASVTAKAALPASGWAHIAATWDGTAVTLYVDGVAQGTAALSGSMPAGTASGIGLGYNPATSSGYLNGLLAECAVYGTALTSQQVAAHFTAGPAATGTPVRVRMALGVIGGQTVNRWYTWQRNGLAWLEKLNSARRGYVSLSTSDTWSVASVACPSPYRGEIRQDRPYAWWPLDDQPLAGGVLPSALRNAALGNTNVLNVVMSPNGTGPSNAYGTDGHSFGLPGYSFGVNLGLATYAVGAEQGWMYGDPQSGQSSYATSNPVTANPGSAAWQMSGMTGNTGSTGWWLSVNDPGFPALASGITAEGWFRYPYFGSTTQFNQSGNHIIAQQPDSPVTLLALTTGSAPVAILQLDTSGHLSLITYSGTTPTSNSVYTSSDLRSGSMHHYAVTLTQTTWTVYVDGGVTAKVSGTATGMTSAWSWLLANADMGNTSGGGTTANVQHGGNCSISHLAVYPAVLPAWRILAHYCAAVTGFGAIPAPQGAAVTFTDISGGTAVAPDGIAAQGAFGVGPSAFSISAVIAAQVGSYTSGPSAWAVSGGKPAVNSPTLGDSVDLTWTGVAPQFAVYTASQAGSETQAAITAANSADFKTGYGASATGYGIGQTSNGSGASPPSSPSALGDMVCQRIERVLGYGQITVPNRAIDSSATLLVQAALDVGGQAAGGSVQNIASSDDGLLSTDNNNTVCYRSRPHLAADTVTWRIGMNVISGMVPFDDTVEWSSDPLRIWDVITVSPYSPDGATLASLTPASAAAANAAQAQFGARPKNIPSYLQDPSKQQAQANWYMQTFGLPQRRASVIAVDAASHPAAWPLVAGANNGDIAQIYDAPLGAPATTGNYRISTISRRVSNGGDGQQVQAKMIFILDPVPASYWS